MTVEKLISLISAWPGDTEVTLRVSDTRQEDYPIEDGDYLDIMDDRSVLMEFGKVVIIGDVPPE